MRTEKELKEEKAEAVKDIKENIIPKLKMVSELVTENKDEVIETMMPLLSFYKDIVKALVDETTDINVDSIINAVAKLEEAGFTREQAIKLITR